jgi:transposase
MVAPMVLDGPINRDSSLCGTGPRARAEAGRHCRHGQPVQPQGARGAGGDRGGRRQAALPSPPYSPYFNPIENAFAKLKALLRKAAERTIDGLWAAIGRLIHLFTPQECANYFEAAGYDAIWV